MGNANISPKTLRRLPIYLHYLRTIREEQETISATTLAPIADRLAGCGIRAIWNFAPVILRVPDGVAVENENLASSLAILSKYVR